MHISPQQQAAVRIYTPNRLVGLHCGEFNENDMFRMFKEMFRIFFSFFSPELMNKSYFVEITEHSMTIFTIDAWNHDSNMTTMIV